MTWIVIASFLLAVFLAFPRRTLTFLWAIDHLVLVIITLGNCKPGEYISSAAWSMAMDDKRLGHVAVFVIDSLFSYWEKDHCLESYLFQQHLYPPKENHVRTNRNPR